MRMASRKFILALIFLSAFFAQSFVQTETVIPETGDVEIIDYTFSVASIHDPEGFDSSKETANSENQTSKTVQINEFVEKLNNGQAGVIRGIYSEDHFALGVVGQPASQPAFVSSIDEIITEFSMPKEYGVIGMLAHNYLAGHYFFDLQAGDIIQIVYGDGAVDQYMVSEIQEYQALSPNSPYSQFKDLHSEEVLSATQLFKRVYMGEHHLTLQTCIQVGTLDSWGRLFLIAEPI